MDEHDTEITLPSVVSTVQGKYRRSTLRLTIIFHPDTNRIGQTAVVPEHNKRASNNPPWVLGRRSPNFSYAAAAVEGVDADLGFTREATLGVPLEDPHVSRRALQLEYTKPRLLIRRFDGASRCRLDAMELNDSLELDEQRLRQGVPLMLGHSVVLLLRLDDADNKIGEEYDGKHLLRGSSSCMQALHRQINAAAKSSFDVLIRGETGTGKELVANAIHQAGFRAQAPMVSVNMAAIPTELSPSLLFGSARGAFTGAEKATAGYFDQAEGGTLFLDEIGDTPVEIQPQLLRALQQREIQAVGGAIRKVDLRIISATDAPLEDPNANFKSALLHRLAACEIFLPALRERPEDIGELLFHFMYQAAVDTQRSDLLPGPDSLAVDVAAWASLFFQASCYHWPGNVRELANMAQQVILASETRLAIGASSQHILKHRAGSPQEHTQKFPRRRMQDVSEEEFSAAMEACEFETTSVAKKLQVSRTAIYRRIESSGEYRLASDVSNEELLSQLNDCAGDFNTVAKSLRVSSNALRQRLRTLENAAQ